MAYLQIIIHFRSFFPFRFVRPVKEDDCVVINTLNDLCPQMANALHNRLLHAIAADDAAREQDDAANDIAAVNLRAEEQ